MYHLDASALIDLWDNYPIHRSMFDNVWEWFDEKVSDATFCISDIALQETKDKIVHDNLLKNTPKAQHFLDILNKIIVFKKTAEDLQSILTIKGKLEIQEEQYHADGVGENDLFIIAIANRKQTILVSNEKYQAILPQNKSRYKIPAVCNMIDLRCINLQELLHQDV